MSLTECAALCIDRLKHLSTEAYYNSRDRPRCTEGTRTDVLSLIRHWASAAPQHELGAEAEDLTTDPSPPATTSSGPVFWLNGFAGSGKSTIAATLCAEWADEGTLGPSFFCSRSDATCKDVAYILPTLAFQLQSLSPSFRKCLHQVLEKNPLGTAADPERQLRDLILKPLSAVKEPLPPYVFVIDALDECEDTSATSKFLATLLRNIEDLKPFHFLITSRSEKSIQSVFQNFPGSSAPWTQYILSDVSVDTVLTDIVLYLGGALSSLHEEFTLPNGWPSEDAIQELANRCQGSFIFAAIAVRFVSDKSYSDPVNRLRNLTVVAVEHHPSITLLDNFYLEILQSSFPKISPELSTQLRRILGAIVLLQEPLPTEDLALLMEIESSSIDNQCIRRLSSVLALSESTTQDAVPTQPATIRMIHPTFPEFLLASSRCIDNNFFIHAPSHHLSLAHRCLSLASESLQLRLGSTDQEEPVERHAAYAVRSWGYHFRRAQVVLDPPLDKIRSLTLRLARYIVTHDPALGKKLIGVDRGCAPAEVCFLCVCNHD